MITKQEIISIANTTKLLPTTVEKDYVLSWVLHGISQHPKLSEWFFKGGTCLKKCYFETYRFSEDLDFTVPNKSIYNSTEIKDSLSEVADLVYENVGINLKTKDIEVEESINKKNKKTFIAKFTYLGPLNLPSRSQQRVKFDITDDEIIVDLPDFREVFHPYTDSPNSPAKIRCYSVNEILAEKTRAIYERQGRSRDIYDVVNISRNFREHIEIKKAKKILQEKFKFKSLPEPSVDLILAQIDVAQLTTNWQDQLAHQVQLLPTAESFHNDLQYSLSWWIDESSAETQPIPISNAPEEITLPREYFPQIIFSPTKKIGIGQVINPDYSGYLDQIRYAARNRLCVKIHYDGVTRLVEPYSLRLPKTQNLLLYVFELERSSAKGGGIKAYKVDKITNAEVTQQSFIPKFIIEL